MLPIFRKRKSYGALVKTKNGFYPIEDSIAKLSVNEISSHLGYDPFHIHTFHGTFSKFSNIEIVALEVFTENVVFILVRDISKRVTEKAVRKFLKGFEYSEEYDSVFIRDYLLEGITNKSLPIDFLSRVLDLPNCNSNEEFIVKKLGVKLFFINNYLASFKLTNDLEEWARHFQSINKDIIANYAKLAKKYWSDDYEMIFKEVNAQSEALAGTPSGYKNKFIPLHKGEFNTVNFLMLLVCHYQQEMIENQFIHFNHGRYRKLGSSDLNIKVYRLDKFIYYFNEKGELLKSEKKAPNSRV